MARLKGMQGDIVSNMSFFPESHHKYSSVIADSTAYNTGGKITVNGVIVTIPKNLQFQFPAAFIPFKEVVAGNFLGNEVSVSQSTHITSHHP